MRKFPILVGILCVYFTSVAQNTDKDFFKTYQRINSQRIFNLFKENFLNYQRDSLEVVEIQSLLEFYNSYLIEEHKLNGKAGFSFDGNENDVTNLYRFGVSGKIDKGAYPSELDFSVNVQTTVQNGEFQENISDIDVSLDFHPLRPSVDSEQDGLWLENYVFIKRFSNNFLGIDQRYDSGAGFVFNLFSKNKLTPTGISNKSQLKNTPNYKIYGDDLQRCLDSCYVKKSVLGITVSESASIVNTRERYLRSNIKKYSKFRIALLVGIYYELEKAIAANEINFNNVDTLLSQTFETTNILRWEVRPSLTWKPNDKYKLKIYPFFKMPFGKGQSIVRQGDLEDRRYDYFLDLMASFSILVEPNFSIALNYRMLYDNAPKRRFLAQEDGSFVLLSGQMRHSSYGVSFNFGF